MKATKPQVAGHRRVGQPRQQPTAGSSAAVVIQVRATAKDTPKKVQQALAEAEKVRQRTGVEPQVMVLQEAAPERYRFFSRPKFLDDLGDSVRASGVFVLGGIIETGDYLEKTYGDSFNVLGIHNAKLLDGIAAFTLAGVLGAHKFYLERKKGDPSRHAERGEEEEGGDLPEGTV